MPHLKDVLVIAVAEGDVFQLDIIAVRRRPEVNRTWPVLQAIHSNVQQLWSSSKVRDRPADEQLWIIDAVVQLFTISMT